MRRRAWDVRLRRSIPRSIPPKHTLKHTLWKCYYFSLHTARSIPWSIPPKHTSEAYPIVKHPGPGTLKKYKPTCVHERYEVWVGSVMKCPDFCSFCSFRNTAVSSFGLYLVLRWRSATVRSLHGTWRLGAPQRSVEAVRSQRAVRFEAEWHCPVKHACALPVQQG